MISPGLLSILCCPEDKTPVVLATSGEVESINVRIRSGQASRKGGQPASETAEGYLIRQDRRIAYPIRNGIPVMLIDEGVLI